MTKVRRTFALALTLGFAFALLAGCDSGGRQSRLRIEIAAPSGGSTCDASLAMEMGLCSSIQVYARAADGTRIAVPLVRPDADHDVTGAQKLRFEGRTVQLDLDTRALPSEAGPFDLELRVFASRAGVGLVPAYGAYVEGVTFQEPEIRVRLYPFREWSCPQADSEPDPQPRALHGAVRLQGGDVLIFGGVSGRDVDPASVRDRSRTGAAHERSVELYDTSEHRFVNIAATDIDGEPGFGRVLFDSVYLGPQDRDGRRVHRIRVIGGLELPGADTTRSVVRFDNTGTTADLGLPVVPAENAEAGRTVDLVFDPQNLSLTVEDAEPSLSVPRGAYVNVSEFNGVGSPDDEAAVLIGLGPIGSGSWEPPIQQYFQLRDESAVSIQMLSRRRLGATVHPLADGTFLVWGGNLGHSDASADDSAGEIVDLGVPSTLVPGGGTRPSSMAFHTGTPVPADPGQERILLVGGYGVAPDGTVFSDRPAFPVAYLEISPSGVVSARPLESVGYVNSIFHAATPFEVIPGVLVTGGASVESGNRLAPQDQVGRVTGGGWSEDGWPALSVGRWGHTVTELPGRRLLVVGGFTRDADSATPNALEASAVSELLYYDAAPAVLPLGSCVDEQVVLDSGVGEGDSGLPPLVDSGPGDAGMPDAGTPDAGDLDAGVDAG